MFFYWWIRRLNLLPMQQDQGEQQREEGIG